MKKAFIIVLLSFLFGCTNEKDQVAEAINTLDQELKQTDSLYVILEQNPDDSILLLMDGTLGRVKNVLADTMSLETEKILEDYLELQSSLNDYKTGMDTIAKEISYSRSQVNDLRKDAAEGTGQLSEITVNAGKELSAIKMLQRNIIKMDSWFDSARGTFITANELLNQKVGTDSLLNVH